MPGLFDPIMVGPVRLRNRIVMPPMANELSNDSGEVTDRHIAHYEARAKSGVGLVIVEHAYIERAGRASPRQLGIYDDGLIPGLKRIVDAVKGQGAAIAIQLAHAGARTTQALAGGTPISPSGAMVPGFIERSRAITSEDMKRLIEAYKAASRRAVEAGFDIVEVHGAHGYLLNQFSSPYTNHRADEYGGSLDNCIRFPLEVVQAVKNVLPPDRALFYRLGADDYTAGGLTKDDGRHIAGKLEEAGVQCVDVSGGLIGSGPDRFSEQGYFVPLAAHVKSGLSVPVIGVGNITEPVYADKIVREGQVDLVAIGRALLRDPGWALKAKERLGSSK